MERKSIKQQTADLFLSLLENIQINSHNEDITFEQLSNGEKTLDEEADIYLQLPIKKEELKFMVAAIKKMYIMQGGFDNAVNQIEKSLTY